MSLWSQSLSFCLCDCENQEERIQCVLSHLAMPVPRSWWEKCLHNKKAINSYAEVLKEICQELHNIPVLKRIDYSLLVALAFIDDELTDNQPKFGTIESQYSLDEYFKMAKKILAKKPELKNLGKMIAELNKVNAIMEM